MTHPGSPRRYRSLFFGLDSEVPVLSGGTRQYINFDNASTTPTLNKAHEAVESFLHYYSSVGRGTGYKSQLSTHVYEEAREIVLDFVGADPDHYVCIFGKNTTDALNKLANRYPFDSQRNLVLTTGMEHHSNDLPWRLAADVVHIEVTPEGRLDEEDLDRKLTELGDRIALVAVTGASNVTGYINPVHQIAEKAHAVGAEIVVDAAQLAPHRKINVRSLDDPSHIDYVTVSAHKLYAPYGSGALIGRRDIFNQGVPDYTGGGTVDIVTLDDIVWADPPARDEAGSPNLIGAVAMAAAIRKLTEIGFEAITAHESELTSYTLSKLGSLEGIQIMGDSDPQNASERLGVIPISVGTLSHFLAAAILGHEYAIGVRSGCFCAHPYILHLLNLTAGEAENVRNRMLTGDRSEMPGLIRISFGLYNTKSEIDDLVEALNQIVHGEYQGAYSQDHATGEFSPQGWDPDFQRFFQF